MYNAAMKERLNNETFLHNSRACHIFVVHGVSAAVGVFGMKWLVKPKFNYVDVLCLLVVIHLMETGQWWGAALLALGASWASHVWEDYYDGTK